MAKLSRATRYGAQHSIDDLKESRSNWLTRHPVLTGIVAVGTVLAATALTNQQLAKRAERMNPPAGQFLDIDGVRLHYIERGEGPVLVMLHGNGSMIADFESSGLVDLAAERHRVIVFDRPGFGHSTRPAGKPWTADAQASLIHSALLQLNVTDAILFGHSWGASVAVAMALRYPQTVRGLILASGYYYPAPGTDASIPSEPVTPGMTDVLGFTVAPVASRIMWPVLMRTMFGPADMPEKFNAFPKEMAVRPSQIRAEAAETAMMNAVAMSVCGDYREIGMPVAIVVGADDRLIDPAYQSGRLHQDIGHSTFHRIADSGHMVHQTHTRAVMDAIAEISSKVA